MADLSDLTASELLEQFEQGDATPSEALVACIERIDQLDGDINAILTPTFEAAEKSAADSTKRWAAGTARPLEGVPYGLKDIIATHDVLTTGGSALYRDWVPSTGAVLADRLENAGGVLVAKLQTFEFACGGADSKTFGPVHNPWDLRRTTGGSSSGSGAAVSAGMMPVAIGTDTGGSIRIPSAYCGITGIKPTYGLVPRTGVMGLSWTMDHAGPMVRSVEDAARVLGVIAGHHPSDSYSSKRAVPDYLPTLTSGIAGLHLGRVHGYLVEQCHPGVLAAYESAIEALADAGAVIVDVELPLADVAEMAGWLVVYAEMLSLHEGHLPGIDDRDEMGAGLLAVGPFVTANDYLRSMRFRAIFQQSVEAAFEGIDALVTPGTVTVAPLLENMLADTGTDFVDWLKIAPRTSLPFNYTGQPAMCVPAGLVDGVPASFQIVGRPHDDAMVFRVGAAFQRQTAHHLVKPAIAVGSTAAASR